jgi:hypothetical protein
VVRGVFTRPHHGVQDREQLAHAGHEGDLVWLADRDQAQIEGPNDRVAPGRDQRAQIAIDGRDPPFEPAEMLGDVSTDGRRGRLQSIALGGQHLEELTAARYQGRELLKDRVGQRTDGWVHPLRKEREETRIQAVGLANCPVDLAKLRTWRGFATTTGSAAAATAARARFRNREWLRGR